MRLSIRSAAVLTAAVFAVGVVVSTPASAAPGVSIPGERCTAEQRTASLQDDQQRVFETLGSLRTLNGPQDLVGLAAAGTYGLESHGWVQYANMGVAMLDLNANLNIIGKQVPGVTAASMQRGTVVSGRPSGLFYRSRQTGVDYHDAYTAHFPYDLVGWFYADVYTPSETPNEVGLCLYRGDWGFHERGVHTFPNFDMAIMPPEEDYVGQKPGYTPLPGPGVPVGLVHPRGWDAHIFLDPHNSTTPITQAFSPFNDIPGVDGGMGIGFPYPVWPDELSNGKPKPAPAMPGMMHH